MKVSLTDAGKRFNRDWIFRHFNYTFEEGRSYAITGPNGAGKSTLLQVLSGSMMLNEGNIQYSPPAAPSPKLQRSEAGSTGMLNTQYSVESVYQQVSISAPYLEVVEEMTLKEFLDFHNGFKPFLKGLTRDRIISILELEKAANKQIRYYSSGMKQRVKLGQCIFSDTQIVLLDEPCTSLDVSGIDLYNQLIEGYCRNRLVIVSSNDELEYRFCLDQIDITDFKQ